jgi:hypothetical protein
MHFSPISDRAFLAAMEEQRVDENNADQWWNDTDGEKLKY